MNFPPTVDLTNAFPFTDENGEAWPGMSIRDYFAAAVLNGYFSNSREVAYTAEDISRMAYKIADAMMVERNKTL